MNSDDRKLSERTVTETMEKYTKQVVEKFEPSGNVTNIDTGRAPTTPNSRAPSVRSIPINYISNIPHGGNRNDEVLQREHEMDTATFVGPPSHPRKMENDFPHLHSDTAEMFPMCTRPSMRAVSPHTTISEHTIHLSSRKCSQNASFTSSKDEFRTRSPSVRVKPHETTPDCHPLAPVPKPPRQYSKDYENLPLLTRDSSGRTSYNGGFCREVPERGNLITLEDCDPLGKPLTPYRSRVVSESEITITRRTNDIDCQPLGDFVIIPREHRPPYPETCEIPFVDCETPCQEQPMKDEPQFCREMRHLVEDPCLVPDRSRPHSQASRQQKPIICEVEVHHTRGEPTLGTYVHVPSDSSYSNPREDAPRINDYRNPKIVECQPECKETTELIPCNDSWSDRNYPERPKERKLETASLRSQSINCEKLHYEYQKCPVDNKPYRHRSKSPYASEPTIHRVQTPTNLVYCTERPGIEYPREVIDPRHHPRDHNRRPEEHRPSSRSTIRSVPIILVDQEDPRRCDYQKPCEYPVKVPVYSRPYPDNGEYLYEQERPWTPTTVHSLCKQEEYVVNRSRTPQSHPTIEREIPIGFEGIGHHERRRPNAPEGIVYPRNSRRPSSVSRCDCGRDLPNAKPAKHSGGAHNPRKEERKLPRSSSVHPSVPRYRDETIVKETFERTTTTRTLNQSTFV